jgi:hypothetical protein
LRKRTQQALCFQQSYHFSATACMLVATAFAMAQEADWQSAVRSEVEHKNLGRAAAMVDQRLDGGCAFAAVLLCRTRSLSPDVHGLAAAGNVAVHARECEMGSGGADAVRTGCWGNEKLRKVFSLQSSGKNQE